MGETSLIDPFVEGKQLAVRVLLWQVLTVLTLAIAIFALDWGVTAAVAAVWGGSAVIAGQGVFSLRHFSRIDSAPRMLNRFFGAAALKWLVLFAVFGCGLVWLKLPAGELLAGLIVAQLAGTWAFLRYG